MQDNASGGWRTLTDGDLAAFERITQIINGQGVFAGRQALDAKMAGVVGVCLTAGDGDDRAIQKLSLIHI